MRLVALLLALSTVGCARNAVLEVVVDDPRGAANDLAVDLAELDATTGCGTFERVLAGVHWAHTATAITAPFSIVTEDPRPVCLRLVVAVTGSPTSLTCPPLVVPSTPWFIGRRTRWNVEIDSSRSDCGFGVDPVDICRAICCDGVLCCDPSVTTCTTCDADGHHYCE